MARMIKLDEAIKVTWNAATNRYNMEPRPILVNPEHIAWAWEHDGFVNLAMVSVDEECVLHLMNIDLEGLSRKVWAASKGLEEGRT